MGTSLSLRRFCIHLFRSIYWVPSVWQALPLAMMNQRRSPGVQHSRGGYEIIANCSKCYERGKTARDDQWWLQMCSRSRELLRKWHFSWNLKGRKEGAPCKHEGRVFLAVNLLEQRPSRGNRPGSEQGKAENKESHTPNVFFPCEYAAFKKLVLKPSNPNPWHFIFWGKHERSLRKNTVKFLCTVHIQNNLIIFNSHF